MRPAPSYLVEYHSASNASITCVWASYANIKCHYFPGTYSVAKAIHSDACLLYTIDFLLSLGLFVCFYVCLFVSLFVSSSLHLVCFGQLLRCADKRIVKIMKMYIERNNMQVELIRFRKKNTDFIHVYFSKGMNTMQYRSPNASLDSCCQTVSFVTSPWSHLSDIVHHSIDWCAGVFL